MYRILVSTAALVGLVLVPFVSFGGEMGDKMKEGAEKMKTEGKQKVEEMKSKPDSMKSEAKEKKEAGKQKVDEMKDKMGGGMKK